MQSKYNKYHNIYIYPVQRNFIDGQIIFMWFVTHQEKLTSTPKLDK